MSFLVGSENSTDIFANKKAFGLGPASIKIYKINGFKMLTICQCKEIVILYQSMAFKILY